MRLLSTHLLVEYGGRLEQVADVGQLFALLLLLLADLVQRGRQRLNVRADVLQRLESVLEVAATQRIRHVNQTKSSQRQ